MIRQILIYGSLFIIALGCNFKSKQTSSEVIRDTKKIDSSSVAESSYKSYMSLDFASVGDISDTNQFFLIDKSCAITIIPDTNWVNEQQKSMSEDDWNTIVDDHQYYESLAEDTLKSYGIDVLYKDANRRFIKFRKENNQNFIIDRQKMRDSWGLILFNGIDNPVLWGSTDIRDAIKDIYKK